MRVWVDITAPAHVLVFRPEAVTALIDRHVAGEEDLSRQLWGLLAFTLWHERHVEREPEALREPKLEALVG